MSMITIITKTTIMITMIIVIIISNDKIKVIIMIVERIEKSQTIKPHSLSLSPRHSKRQAS